MSVKQSRFTDHLTVYHITQHMHNINVIKTTYTPNKPIIYKDANKWYDGEKTNPSFAKKPPGSEPFLLSISLLYLGRWIWSSQHGCSWSPGAHLAPGHLQQSSRLYWYRPTSACMMSWWRDVTITHFGCEGMNPPLKTPPPPPPPPKTTPTP